MRGYGFNLDDRIDKLNINSERIKYQLGYSDTELFCVFRIDGKEILKPFKESYEACLNSMCKPVEEVDWYLTHGVVVRIMCDNTVVRDYTKQTPNHVFVKDM